MNTKTLILIIVGIALLAAVFVFLDRQKATKEVGQPKGGEPEMELTGKKILMVVAPKNFRDEEFLEPKKIFEAAGAEVVVASKDVSVASGMFGATASVDRNLSQVKIADYDAVVFVGGAGAQVYFADETALNLAKEAYSQEKVVGAICIAPSILANAGILEGKNATAFSSEQENLENKGVTFTGEPVTVDGKIVTGSGPEAASEFGQKIVEAF